MRTANGTAKALLAGIVAVLMTASILQAHNPPAWADDGAATKAQSTVAGANPEDSFASGAELAARQVATVAEQWSALGYYVDPSTQDHVVVLPATTTRAIEHHALTPSVSVRTVKSAHTRATIDAAITRITERAWHPAARQYAYGSHYNARRDAVIVGTDAPADVLQPLFREFPRAIVHEPGRASRTSRHVDGPPHWGGASINDYNGSGLDCTSGFTVRNGAGTRFMVTAGHCFTGGTAVKSTGGGGSFGSVENRAPFPLWDMELLGGGSYGASIYTGGASGVGTRVGGASDPVVGATYCYSGAVTYEQCGKLVDSVTGFYCDPQGGCTYGLIVYTGGTINTFGDSGAPFYLPGSGVVYIRGVVIARDGGRGYAEKWSTVANYFGVSIVA